MTVKKIKKGLRGAEGVWQFVTLLACVVMCMVVWMVVKDETNANPSWLTMIATFSITLVILELGMRYLDKENDNTKDGKTHR